MIDLLHMEKEEQQKLRDILNNAVNIVFVDGEPVRNEKLKTCPYCKTITAIETATCEKCCWDF
mgnify:CR=1 FL=1